MFVKVSMWESYGHFSEKSNDSQELMSNVGRENTIYHEMLLDLCYRLRLADDLFCQASNAVMSSIKGAVFEEKVHAIALINAYSKTLQIIYSDFQLIISGCQVIFPCAFDEWQWNEPDATEHIMRILERLHDIADGMQMKLDVSLLKAEVEK